MKKIFLAFVSLLSGMAGCTTEKYATVGNAEFMQFIAQPGMQIVDVRTPQEFAEGHIPGAQNIDIRSEEFDRRAAGLDKTYPVAVYCRSGMRSRTAAARLAEMGFEVVNLRGGMIDWDGPVEK